MNHFFRTVVLRSGGGAEKKYKTRAATTLKTPVSIPSPFTANCQTKCNALSKCTS